MNFIEKIEKRLTADDVRQLKDIYEPEEVAVPDENAWNNLCVTREGEIRFYGLYKPTGIYDKTAPKCYIESKDGGLSWKRYIEDKDTLGASAYVPFMDKYLTAVLIAGKGISVRIGFSPDDENYSETIIEGADFVDNPMPPVILNKRKRILLMATERRPWIHPTAYFPIEFYTDDCGKSWKRVIMGCAPFFEKLWPHQGMRWEQNNREMTVVEHDDGRLTCITRNTTDFHCAAVSSDGGETWSEFTLTDFSSSGTMPYLKRLSDGRILFLFCNTKMLPEVAGADGMWEDFFTNRDACHAAISEDDGKTWKGFREIRLNPLRCASDYRSFGGTETGLDKSIHQFEAIELPFHKILVANGQHAVCRRILIFDINWLYEMSRKEDFLCGMKNISTQTYVKSVSGSWPGFGHPEKAMEYSGHSAYNRTNSARLLPNPWAEGKEVLHLAVADDNRLVNGFGGAVWNFPSSRKGKITISAFLPGKGLRVSLFDCWVNPSDDTVGYIAPYSIVLRKDMQTGECFTRFTIEFDCDEGSVVLRSGEQLYLKNKLNGKLPHGLNYLHFQTAVGENDPVGSYLEGWQFESNETLRQGK